MTTIHYLTIGYIPKDCNSDRIICGDPAESGTIEVFLRVEENRITSIDTDQTIEINPSEFFDEKSNLWKQVVLNFCSEFVEKGLKPNMVGACWAIFMDEVSSKRGITKLADEDDGGEFHNRGGCNNGKFYVRYQLEEDDEYFGEQVLGFE